MPLDRFKYQTKLFRSCSCSLRCRTSDRRPPDPSILPLCDRPRAWACSHSTWPSCPLASASSASFWTALHRPEPQWWLPEPWWSGLKRYADYLRRAAWPRDKHFCEAWKSPSRLISLMDWQPRDDRCHPAVISGNQKILTALSSVFHTPQASGTPTNAQNSAALTSSPPVPMPPNEPDCTPAALFALAACSLATSSALMFHFGSTGLIR